MSLAKRLLSRINEHILRDSQAASSGGGDSLALQAALNKFLVKKGIVSEKDYKLIVKEGEVVGGVTVENPIRVYVGYLGTAELIHGEWKVEPYDSVLATEEIAISTSLPDCAQAIQDRLEKLNFEHAASNEKDAPQTIHFGTITEIIETFSQGQLSDQTIGQRTRITAQGDKTEDLDIVGEIHSE